MPADRADDAAAHGRDLKYRNRAEADHRPTAVPGRRGSCAPASPVKCEFPEYTGVDIRFQANEVPHYLVEILDTDKGRINAKGGGLRKQVAHRRQRRVFAPV